MAKSVRHGHVAHVKTKTGTKVKYRPTTTVKKPRKK